jgi:hypothetical protein
MSLSEFTEVGNMGLELFKWTALVVGVITFVFSLIRGDGVLGSLIAALFLAVIAGGLVSFGKDRVFGS